MFESVIIMASWLKKFINYQQPLFFFIKSHTNFDIIFASNLVRGKVNKYVLKVQILCCVFGNFCLKKIIAVPKYLNFYTYQILLKPVLGTKQPVGCAFVN